jgi:hypothetical protein
MKRLTQLAGVCSFLPTLAHEATHWAIARCGTADAEIAVEVTGGRALAAWPPLESRALRVVAFLGPTVFGSALALLWLFSGISVDGWRLIMAVGLAIYTVPSAQDVRGALGRQGVQQEADS